MEPEKIADTIVSAMVAADQAGDKYNALIPGEGVVGFSGRTGALTGLSTKERDEVLRLVEEKLRTRTDRVALSWMRSRGVVTQLDGMPTQDPATLIGNKNVALDVRVQDASDVDEAVRLITNARAMGTGVLYVPVRSDLERELRQRLGGMKQVEFVSRPAGFYAGQKFDLNVFLPALQKMQNADLSNTLLAISGDYVVSDRLWREYNGRRNLKMILLVELLSGIVRAMPIDPVRLQNIDRFARPAIISA